MVHSVIKSLLVVVTCIQVVPLQGQQTLEQLKASLGCPAVCSQSVYPVCARNGVTYSNQCIMAKASCNNADGPILKAYDGRCKSNNDDDDDVVINPGSTSGVIDRRDSNCPSNCPSTQSIVCGTDGVTYVNECSLRQKTCTNRITVTVQHNGRCRTNVQTQETPTVQCADACPANYAPVCGTDGKTYSNACILNSQACRSGSSLSIQYEGECVVSQTTKPIYKPLKCQEACIEIYSPVCGSDGKTYSNDCFLKLEACRSGKQITIRHDGKCEKNKCPEFCTKEFRPVCGTDGRTYNNDCLLKMNSCRPGNEGLAVKHKEKCVQRVQNNDCPTICPQLLDPVCGTDAISYTNECYMRLDNCGSNVRVLAAYKGECKNRTPATCIQGSRWTYQCNNCSCSSGRPICTKRLCVPGDPNKNECTNGSLWKIDACNWCRCNNGIPECQSGKCGNLQG